MGGVWIFSGTTHSMQLHDCFQIALFAWISFGSLPLPPLEWILGGGA
jgi:hypothetical protein